MSPNKLLLKVALQSPYLFIGTVLFGFSGAVFNSVSVTLIVPLILSLLGQEASMMGSMPPVIQQAMGFADNISGDYRVAILTAVVFLAIALKNFSGYASNLVGTALGQSISRTLRYDGVDVFLNVDIDFYSNNKIGDIMNKINAEMSRTSAAIRSFSQLVVAGITIVFFVIILTSISWQLTLTSIIVLSLVVLINQVFIKRAKKFGQKLTNDTRALTNKLIETLSGINLIKTVATEDLESNRLKELIYARERSEFKSQANSAIISPINETAGIMALLMIVLAARYLFVEQIEALSAVILTYLLLLFRLLPVVGTVNNIRSGLSNKSASILVVSDYLDRTNKPFMKNGSIPFKKLTKGIKFESVDFRYGSGNQELALQNIDLWIPRGKTVALVGSSGAGKSTLADLIPRFYDPCDGRIKFDDEDLRSYDLKTIRRRMGIVSQDTFLFNNSVLYNLTYGCEWAGEAEAIDAAKRANAYEFIMNLPQGFDTDIGDRGVMLSGGQRQRLAIARAIIRDPEILILDEATSALDTLSERLVQEAIEELCHDRTTIVIAHRLSTIRNADQIVVMERGQIMEVGDHSSLLERDGYYSTLYQAQFAQDNEDAIQQARRETLINTSYEVRTRLNPMIGFLNLLVDDIVDSPEERQELTQEAYESAVRLLKTLQFLESSARAE
ncbi:MAG: ATP-binding cassette domain-containing protein [Phormidium sp. BM_Day4_Bin.17]|nr:ATP-binding cassette domain-containing protein [Phormidium sp. BM_Day4_Bin.17]UCJ12691.1 MAG: ATP-binding cassette domain-containing protein [Phormidium sp. PBR-2020]